MGKITDILKNLSLITVLNKISIKANGTDHPIEITDNYVYDDIQVNISISRRGANPPNDARTYDYGISGGVEFLCSGFAIGEGVDITVQTSHQMALNTILDQHMHYILPSDGVGDRMNWQLDVIAAGIGGTYAAAVGSPFTSEHVIGADEHVKHSLFELADIPAMNTTVSSLYRCRLTRIAATQDEYGSEVYVDFLDGHYKKDTLGSRTEGAK